MQKMYQQQQRESAARKNKNARQGLSDSNKYSGLLRFLRRQTLPKAVKEEKSQSFGNKVTTWRRKPQAHAEAFEEEKLAQQQKWAKDIFNNLSLGNRDRSAGALTFNGVSPLRTNKKTDVINSARSKTLRENQLKKKVFGEKFDGRENLLDTQLKKLDHHIKKFKSNNLSNRNNVAAALDATLRGLTSHMTYANQAQKGTQKTKGGAGKPSEKNLSHTEIPDLTSIPEELRETLTENLKQNVLPKDGTKPLGNPLEIADAVRDNARRIYGAINALPSPNQHRDGFSTSEKVAFGHEAFLRTAMTDPAGYINFLSNVKLNPKDAAGNHKLLKEFHTYSGLALKSEKERGATPGSHNRYRENIRNHLQKVFLAPKFSVENKYLAHQAACQTLGVTSLGRSERKAFIKESIAAEQQKLDSFLINGKPEEAPDLSALAIMLAEQRPSDASIGRRDTKPNRKKIQAVIDNVLDCNHATREQKRDMLLSLAHGLMVVDHHHAKAKTSGQASKIFYPKGIDKVPYGELAINAVRSAEQIPVPDNYINSIKKAKVSHDTEVSQQRHINLIVFGYDSALLATDGEKRENSASIKAKIDARDAGLLSQQDSSLKRQIVNCALATSNNVNASDQDKLCATNIILENPQGMNSATIDNYIRSQTQVLARLPYKDIKQFYRREQPRQVAALHQFGYPQNAQHAQNIADNARDIKADQLLNIAYKHSSPKTSLEFAQDLLWSPRLEDRNEALNAQQHVLHATSDPEQHKSFFDDQAREMRKRGYPEEMVAYSKAMIERYMPVHHPGNPARSPEIVHNLNRQRSSSADLVPQPLFAVSQQAGRQQTGDNHSSKPLDNMNLNGLNGQVQSNGYQPSGGGARNSRDSFDASALNEMSTLTQNFSLSQPDTRPVGMQPASPTSVYSNDSTFQKSTDNPDRSVNNGYNHMTSSQPPSAPPNRPLPPIPTNQKPYAGHTGKGKEPMNGQSNGYAANPRSETPPPTPIPMRAPTQNGHTGQINGYAGPATNGHPGPTNGYARPANRHSSSSSAASYATAIRDPQTQSEKISPPDGTHRGSWTGQFSAVSPVQGPNGSHAGRPSSHVSAYKERQNRGTEQGHGVG